MQCIRAVLDAGWDGEWFLRAYDAYSHKVGSRECEEGQIFIEPQGFCVLAGIGVQGRAGAKSPGLLYKEHLDTKYGVMLLQPALYQISPGAWRSHLLPARDTRKMPVSSATIIPGFPSRKPLLAEAIAPLRYIGKPVPLIWKISVKSTAPSLTCTAQMVAGKDAPRHR